MLFRMTAILLCLFCATAQAGSLSLDRPFFELVERNITEPIALSDIDVAVPTTQAQCAVEYRRGLFGKPVSSSNEKLLQSWLCISFEAAAADPAQQLAFHPIFLDASPAEAASVSATVAHLGDRAGTRRYVALVEWRIDNMLAATSPCGFGCSSHMNVPMEIALFDRQSGKTVWHALLLNQSRYSNTKYDEAEAASLGPGAITAALTQMMVAEKTRNEAQAIGATQVAALLTDTPATLDPAVNLILINDDRQGPRNENYLYYRPSTFIVKRLDDQSGAKSAYYFPSYHGFVALKLAPGEYEVSLDKVKRNVTIAAGTPPLYLAQSHSLSLFTHGAVINEVNAAGLLAMFKDGVNWTVPEATEGSWQGKKRALRWMPQ
ncbi:hypothetical protein GTP81_18380 [Rugamonas sp. FT107W]|uniref:Uncharacterized protein n=1 Tax=Duganella vulcania TaxID=2692166 RepID=A0A845HIV4_9BURK|nr:hypothetical protein [Duganella vulcania]MYN18720.1 hypothetical protein [Duganella vulcania]